VGLVQGKHLSVDGSFVEANAAKESRIPRTLIALTFLLTLEDPHRFRKSRDVGCYLGMQPGRRNSGQSDPQMHISKEGDPYLRTLLLQGAHWKTAQGSAANSAIATLRGPYSVAVLREEADNDE